jgi:hypothetical protein
LQHRRQQGAWQKTIQTLFRESGEPPPYLIASALLQAIIGKLQARDENGDPT